MANDTTSEKQKARRAFLHATGRKAAYVAPIVTVLAAGTKAYGSNVYFSFCGDVGSPCVMDSDCCTGLDCTMMECEPE